jgi:hypothetical protein
MSSPKINPDVDLTFSEVKVPKTVKINEPFTIDRTVTNQGKEKTGDRPWYDEVYLSADSYLDVTDDYNYIGDYVLKSNNTDRPLEASQNYTLSDSVTIPPGFFKQYFYDSISDYALDDYINVDHNKDWYLIFKTDIYKKQDETNEENNLFVVPIDIESPNLDLVMSKVTAPEKGTIDSKIEVSWTVDKQGEGKVQKNASWADKIYLSNDGVLDEVNDYLLGKSESRNLLTNSDSYTVSQSFPIPKKAYDTTKYQDTIVDPDRDWYVIVEADYDNKIAETKKDNNYISVPIDIEKPQVDLVVDRINTSKFATLGQPLNIAWTISNRGTENSNSLSWYDRVLFSSDPVFNQHTSYPLSFREHQELLTASRNYTENLSINIPQELIFNIPTEIGKDGQAVKNGYLFLQTDTWDSQIETNEDNNTKVLPIAFKVTQPDLVVDRLQIPQVVKIGDLVHFDWAVANKEPIATNSDSIKYQAFLSSSPYGDTYDYDLGTITNKDKLYPSSSAWSNGQWQIPDANKFKDLDPNRRWWFVLKVDSDDRILEFNETNNVIIQPIQLVNNFIDGTEKNDKIIGTEGKDFIRGLSGNDAIDGGKGNDLLIGGMGIDTLTGGEGSNDFVFKKLETSIDVITDFQIYKDRLVLTELLDSLNYPNSTKFEDGKMEYNWDSFEYIHSNGYLKLVEDSNDTAVYIDPDGMTGEKSWNKIIAIENSSPGDFVNNSLVL